MEYEVQKQLLRGPKVAFKCRGCSTPLEAPLTDAGKRDVCPVCNQSFVTPGAAELEAMNRAAAEKAAEAARRTATATRERPTNLNGLGTLMPLDYAGPKPVQREAPPRPPMIPVKIEGRMLRILNKTFAVANLSSVEVHSEPGEPPYKPAGVFVVLVSIFVGFGGLIGLGEVNNGGSVLMVVLAAAGILGGIIAMYMPGPLDHSIILVTNGGEREQIHFDSLGIARDVERQIVRAMNETA